MSRNTEIEMKLLFSSKEKIVSLLGSSMEFQGKKSIRDVYYTEKGKGISNDKHIFRLRREDNKEAELTYKGASLDNEGIWHREELNVGIKDGEVMEKILGILGLERFSEYTSKREYWKFGNANIVFINFFFPAELEFMEIEASSEEQIKEIVEILGNEVSKAGEEIFEVFDRKRKNSN